MSDAIAIWWRDDDAGRHDTRLDRLLELAATLGRPLALAIVPAWLDGATTRRVLEAQDAYVLQHGWAHADHAPPGGKSIELGGSVDPDICRDDLARGAAYLRAAFTDRFLPVMVPPWNRIEPTCLEMLAGLGFTHLSTFAEDRSGAARGVRQVNAHVDLVDWRGTRRMKPVTQLIREFDALMQQPGRHVIGLLTHHLEMTLDDMARLRQLLSHVDRHERCRWVDLPRLFSDR